MTCEDNYSKLRSFISAFPRNVESKKDLRKMKDKRLKQQYYAYRSYFKIKGNLRPDTVLHRLKRYKKRNIYFKSEELKIDLINHKDFNDSDIYNSSSKLIAKTTDAMLGKNITLASIETEYKDIDIRYKTKASRKIVRFDTIADNVTFMENLPDDYYINIGKSSYNKNGLDFIYDYHNQSQDFFKNFEDLIKEENFFIYQR